MSQRTKSEEQSAMKRSTDRRPLMPRRLRRWAALSAASLLTLAVAASPSSAAVEWTSETFPGPSHLPPGGTGHLLINPANMGSTASSAPPLIEVQLPAGVTASSGVFGGYSCTGATAVTCTSPSPVSGYLLANKLGLPIAIDPGLSGSSDAIVTVSGGGAVSPSVELVRLTFSSQPFGFGVLPGSLFAGAFDSADDDYTVAGGHPYYATAGFKPSLGHVSPGQQFPNQGGGHVKDIVAELPPGFVGDPTAAPRCPRALFAGGRSQCPVEAQVGLLFLYTPQFPSQTSAVWNLEPGPEAPALFGFYTPAGPQTAIPSVRSDGDYGITVSAKNITEAGVLYRSELLIWGDPADPSHDSQRCVQPNPTVLECVGISQFGLSEPGNPDINPNSSSAPRLAFLSNPTNCADELSTTIHFSKWHDPAPQGDFSDPRWSSVNVSHPGLTDCEQLKFRPTISLQTQTKQADSPTGLDVHLHIPRKGDSDPDGQVEAHLKKTTVVLPEGIAFNAGAADGLAACTPEQIGMTSAIGAKPIRFNNVEPSCPDASKIGTGEVITPLLEDHLRGEVFLASQDRNPFDSTFAIYIVVREPSVLVKLAGAVELNEATGQITTTFDQNPQLPFEDFLLEFYGGPRGALATPVTCGTFTSNTELTPWSAKDPENPTASEVVNHPDPFTVDSSPSGACVSNKAQLPLNVGLSAGSRDPIAGAKSPFDIRITRPDGNQELDRLEISQPPGFVASLKGVPYCTDAQLAAAASRDSGKAEQQSPSCPAASQIGTTNVGAGAGSAPLYTPGKLYLSGPYKGAPLSVAAITPAVAGPYDLGNVVVRSALKVDPVTARITAITDSLPRAIEGVPLRIRDVRIALDRPDWAQNPTSCEAKSVDVTAHGADGASAGASNRFQVGGCANLAFKPRVDLQLFGGVRRAAYQGVRAVIRPRPGDANISGAVVRFPTSAFVAQEHLNNICTRVQWANGACPKSSIYGTAEARSPLLEEPLKGNVHLRSSDNLLPDLVADLRGPAHQPIRVEVAIRNDSVKGALRNTVQSAPDAPVSLFRLQTFGGNKGLIVNSRNVCKGRSNARITLDAHNGRRSVQSVPVRNAKCGKWRKAQKRKAAKRKALAERSARRR